MLALVRKAFQGLYEVEREIGKGGNARIYLARKPQGNPVALKILHPELLVSVAADRFLREIKLASQLDHPHIAKLLDSGERDWIVYYVMTYVEGANLREVMNQGRRMSIADMLRLAGDLLDALDHAHARGIIHRNEAMVLQLHLTQPAPDLRTLRPEIPAELAGGLTRALAKTPEERWQSAAAMRDALTAVVVG